jgi:hypothetical protein
MYVASKLVGTPLGVMGNGAAAAPGLGLMPVSDYTGDYSTVEVDPTDGMTFWAANEYIGADGDTDTWRTHIASFQATVDPGANYYAVRAKQGDSLDISITVPGADPGQFDNAFIPAVYLYDPSGALVAFDEAQDGGDLIPAVYLYDPSGALVAFDEAQDGGDPTVTIHFQVPAHGQGDYTIQVAPSPLTSQPTQGEYALVVSKGEAGESAAAAAAGSDGRGAAIVHPFAALSRDAAGARDAGSGSGRAALIDGASSPSATAVLGALDRPQGPLGLHLVGKQYSGAHTRSDQSGFRAQRRAGVAMIKSLPRERMLLRPGVAFEYADEDRS